MKTSILRTIIEDGKSLALRRRGAELDLVLGNVVLLSSAALETERAFGHLGKGTSVLVGGLGFGATLRGVLDVAPKDARIRVVEKLAAVIDVARREAAALVSDALEDPRVTLEQGDVVDAIERERNLDAILLDVDNGPEWASFRTNARLYGDAALVRAKESLAPSGIFAVWSGYAADSFMTRLRHAGFVARIEPLRERGVVRARAYVGMRAP